jgi:hypothetical protein
MLCRYIGGVVVELYPFVNLGVSWGRLINAAPRELCPGEKVPVPALQEAVGPTTSLDVTGNITPAGEPRNVQLVASCYACPHTHI